MSIKYLIFLYLFLVALIRTEAQVNTMIVKQFKKIMLTKGNDTLYYDLSVGYCENIKDTVRIVTESGKDSLSSGTFGDSVNFQIIKLKDAKRNLQNFVEGNVLFGDTNYLYVNIKSVCRKSQKKGCYGDTMKIVTCYETLGPIYYLNGKAVYSEDSKENRRLKKKYKKALKK